MDLRAGDPELLLCMYVPRMRIHARLSGREREAIVKICCMEIPSI